MALIAPSVEPAVPMRSTISRRAALLILAAGLPALAVAGCQTTGSSLSADEAARLRFRTIEVDLAPLRSAGAGPQADFLRARLLASLRSAFADRIDPKAGAVLSVRVNALQLGTFVGASDGDPYEGGGPSDYLGSDALMMGGSVVRATYPILSAVPASSAGPWYAPDIDARRVAALAEHHARWIRTTILGR